MANPLAGRADELRRLRELTCRAVSGQGTAVLIEGEPGIGKTALLDAVAGEAARRGARVLRGGGAELARRLSFAAIMSCLGLPGAIPDADLARLTALLRGEGTVLAGAADQEYVVAEAILDQVDQWCAAGPAALLVDDLQWADPASLLVLSRLGTTIQQFPLLLVVAYQPVLRDGELTSLVHRLRARGAVTMTLGPLDEPDGTDRTDGPLPGSLTGVLARRLGLLATQTRELLGVAAVLGAGFTLTELSTVLGAPVIDLWLATSEAVQAGLLAEAEDRLVFRHDLIRRALAEGIPTAMRDALLTQAAQSLAAAGAPVERVAEHFVASGTVDGRTADWLATSADQLIVRAPALAVDLLERVAGRADLTPQRQADLRLHLAWALLWVCRPRDAERAVQTALTARPEPADPVWAAVLCWLLAQAYFQQGYLEQAATEALRALRATDPATAAAARWHGFLAQCRLLQGQAEAAAAQAAAQASGDAYGTAYGRYIEAGVRMMDRRCAEGVALADQALVALGTREIHPDLQLAPYLIRGFCLCDLDRYPEADEAFELGLRQSERGGHAFRTWHHMGRARLWYLNGRWDDALAEIEGALAGVDPFGMAEGLRSQARQIAWHRGDFTRRTELLDAADTTLAGRYWDHLRMLVRALAEESAGDPDRALGILLDEWGTDRPVPPPWFDGLYPDLVRLALATGRTAELRPVAAALGRLAGQGQATSTRALQALCRGAVQHDAELLRAASDRFRQTGRVVDEAYGYECTALVLGEQGRVAEARTALNSALDRYERLDAAWDIGRAEGYLRQLGGRRRRAKLRPRTGWGALTATERRVATFVVEGRSNPDIAAEMYLSRRTVQSHVSSILTKLGLTSRVELVVSAYARKAAGSAEPRG